MKLSDNTVGILQNFANINNGILIAPGNQIKTISPNKTILASAKVEEDFDTQFCIYDLSQFLSTISMFSSAELNFEKDLVVISDGSAKIKYTYADPKTIVVPPDKVLSITSDISFKLSAAILQKAMKAANVLGLPNLVFSSENGSDKLMIKSTDVKNSTSNELTIDIDAKDCYTVPDNEFKMVFKFENLKLKTGNDMSYQVDISKVGISKFTEFEKKNLEYFIAVETADSKFVK